MSGSRPLIEQTWVGYALTVNTTPTPVNSNAQLTSMIDSFLVCVPQAATNNVYMGDANVSITTGIEIIAGTTQNFRVAQVRQLYELQYPILDSSEALTCQTPNNQLIPFVCWDMANVNLIAPAATVVTIMLFKVVYY